MATKNAIDRLTIKGFKSIRSLENLHLDSLNVLIGANGAGKSSFVSYFRMLSEMVDLRLQKWTAVQGGADRVVSYGVKETQRVESFVRFGLNGYKFALEPTVDGGFVFADERLFFEGPYYGDKWISLGSGQIEAKLYERFQSAPKNDEADYCYSSIASWKVFYFHDTSDTAGVKRWGALHDSEGLRPDASNLAAYLHRLAREHRDVYEPQSVPLVNEFTIDELVIVERENGDTVFKRHDEDDFKVWLETYSVGELWEKNVLGGRPRRGWLSSLGQLSDVQRTQADG
jgi:predicted ATPase